MMNLKGVIIITLLITYLCECRVHRSKDTKTNDISKPCNNGNPLFLTPYIEDKDFKTARELSLCGSLPDVPQAESYSGFMTVNKEYNSNIFFWFFPAMNNNKSAPIILWLQGGPGISGLFGLFVEHGPYVIQSNMTVALREIHWAKTFQLLYVDNPVGTGFSFTDDVRGYVTNQQEMAEDMYEFLQQFFTLFPEYQRNDFYIAGESYAGKYVPSLAHKIHLMGESAKMTLKGIAVGNGMCDPETMMNYSEYLYNIGLIDGNQAKVMKKLTDNIVEYIKKGDYYEAFVGMVKLIFKYDLLPLESLFKNNTGMDFYYNFLVSKTPDDFSYWQDYIEKPEFREAVHVGDLPFQTSTVVGKHLLLDIMKSVKPNVTEIMNNYRVLIYNGQLDIIIPYPLTINFLKSVTWKYAEEYGKAERKIWYRKNSNEIAGYVHNVEDFYEIMVRNTGHILPYDNPEVGFDLISRFLNNESYA